MAFSLSANLGRMRLSRCSRSTRDDASCCQSCLSLLLVRTRRVPSGLGQSMPRGWVETFHTNQSQPSTKATTMLLATSGCLWWIMARESAQLAQKAESWVRTALRNPNPPRTKGASRHP